MARAFGLQIRHTIVMACNIYPVKASYFVTQHGRRERSAAAEIERNISVTSHLKSAAPEATKYFFWRSMNAS